MQVVSVAASPRSRSRRARPAIFALSILLHGFVFGWFALRQDRTAPSGDLPPMAVELVRAPPRVGPSAPPSEARGIAAPRDISLPPIAPRYVPAPPGGAVGAQGGDPDLFGPVFADGHWPRPVRLKDCDPVKDPDLTSEACRRELAIARGVTRAHDPRNGADEFAREARHNEAMRAYHDAPGTSGYPGLRCAIFHRC